MSLGISSTVAADWYKPLLNTRAQIQLQGTLNRSFAVDLYVIDLFDTSAQTIQSIKTSGAKVICYFSAGSYENWRPDIKSFAKVTLGKSLSGWPGERWLDIRAASVRKVMQARIALAASKGCDGVDPDNVDGYTNGTGFPLKAADQLSYNRFLATEAHSKNLSIGLKNDLNQISELVNDFDFSINEQCHEYNECSLLDPFIYANKPVFNVEYQKKYISDANGVINPSCLSEAGRGFKIMYMPYLLDGTFRVTCD